MNKKQTIRTALLQQQGHKCGICGAVRKVPDGMCHAIEQNVLLCRPCMAYLSSYKDGASRGVTPDTLAAFLAQSPAPEPTASQQAATQPQLTKTEAKNRNTQLRNRWYFAIGKQGYTYQDGLAGWDERFNLSGPVINMDTGQAIELSEYSLEHRLYGMSLLGGE